MSTFTIIEKPPKNLITELEAVELMKVAIDERFSESEQKDLIEILIVNKIVYRGHGRYYEFSYYYRWKKNPFEIKIEKSGYHAEDWKIPKKIMHKYRRFGFDRTGEKEIFIWGEDHPEREDAKGTYHVYIYNQANHILSLSAPSEETLE